MKIAILDSGVNLLHPELIDKNIVCKIIQDDIAVDIKENNDSIGHGTAVCGIITKHAPSSEITMYKIFDEHDYISDLKLIKTLEYILLNEKFDILCLCIGISSTDNMVELENICEDIVKSGTVIVSSFNNIGAMTYPAAFDTVIGVDWDIACKCDNDLIYCKDGFVDVYAKGMNQKLCWSGKTKYIINCGASFATAHVVGFLAANEKNFLEWNYENAISFIERNAKKVLNVNTRVDLVRYNEKNYKRVALFPLSKEIKTILRFSEFLSGEISEVFDIRESGKTGRKITEDSYLDCLKSDLVIKSIEDIDLFKDKIDTLVVGHLGEINRVTGKNYTKMCIDYCINNNITLVSFDSIPSEIKDRFDSASIACYSINVEKIQYDPSEKLFSIGKAVVSVMGTSSQQGKFTLQMELRRFFENEGYKVGQWSSEPQGALLTSNQVFPTGYNSNISFSEKEVIGFINYQLHDIEKSNPDIILSGIQSYVLSDELYNMHSYPSLQSAIIAGLNPDAIVLIVNHFDARSYILRTINYLESWVKAKVVCVVLSFKNDISTWSPTEVRQTELSALEINQYLLELSKLTQKPCFYINETEKIYLELLSFFSQED